MMVLPLASSRRKPVPQDQPRSNAAHGISSAARDYELCTRHQFGGVRLRNVGTAPVRRRDVMKCVQSID
jgi:hypothetical protein